MKLLELSNEKFPYWVVWIEVPPNHARISRYRDFWVDYLNRKHDVYGKIQDWLWESGLTTTRNIAYRPDCQERGVGFESKGEALQFMLTFSEQISSLERGNG